MRKWGLHYDGGKGAEDFLEQLQCFQKGYGDKPEQCLPGLALIFRGEALSWYMNKNEQWETWEDFTKDFNRRYLPRNRLPDLEDKIRDRRQKPGESAQEYIGEMETMIRRHGGINEEQSLQRIYRNLRAEHKRFIREEEVKSVDELLDRLRQLEITMAEYRQQQATTWPASRRTTQVDSAAAVNPKYDRATCCWKCGQRGHSRYECRRAQRLFCSYCGTEGRTTSRCPCNSLSGNDNRISGRGTDRSGHHQRPPQEAGSTQEPSYQ